MVTRVPGAVAVVAEHAGHHRVLRARWVAWFFLWTSGIHVGIVAADTGFYRHFADQALVPGLSHLWRTEFMAHAAAAGLLVAAGEALIAGLLLGGRPHRQVGWLLAIVFHVALMCFGWGFWFWSVPALGLLVLGARADSSVSRS